VRAKGINAKNKIFFWERIAFRISVGFILPVIVSAYALYSVSAVFSELSATKETMQRKLNSIHQNESNALLTLYKMRINAHVVLAEPTQESLARIEVQPREFHLDLVQSRKILDEIAVESAVPVDVAVGKFYEELKNLQLTMSEQVKRLLEARSQGNPAGAHAVRRELEVTSKSAEAQIARLRAKKEAYVEVISKKLLAEEDKSKSLLNFYLGAVFLFGIAAAILVTYSIIHPVKQLMNRIRDIATGDGDLTKRVHLRAGGEMTELGFWLNIFLDKTHDIISTISNASSVVSQTTEKVGQQASMMTVAAAGINKAMMEQSMNIDECTGRVSNIDDLIQNSGESTRQAASLSKIAMDRALQGGASVHETVEAMEKIEESARKVEELMSSINEIASQTNLLAINAAIEATKAGEHGKGFAVVAEEVRKLAERARKLTAEVTSLINESNGRVKAGVGLARGAGVSLDGIIKDVEAVSSLIQRIASAAAKQTESSTVVLEFMQRVSESVRTNLTEMEGVTRSTELTSGEVAKLDALVGQLNQVVGQFRLDEEGSDVGSYVQEHVEQRQAMQRLQDSPLDKIQTAADEPGEINFEAMMNPVPRAPSDAPPLPPAAPIRGLAPLPQGASPVEEGDEDAA